MSTTLQLVPTNALTTKQRPIIDDALDLTEQVTETLGKEFYLLNEIRNCFAPRQVSLTAYKSGQILELCSNVEQKLTDAYENIYKAAKVMSELDFATENTVRLEALADSVGKNTDSFLYVRYKFLADTYAKEVMPNMSRASNILFAFLTRDSQLLPGRYSYLSDIKEVDRCIKDQTIMSEEIFGTTSILSGINKILKGKSRFIVDAEAEAQTPGAKRPLLLPSSSPKLLIIAPVPIG